MAQNLAAKYRPSTWEDVTEQGVVVDIFKNIFESSDDITVRNFLLVGPAGCGKAQPLDSKVFTPTGYVNMRDIKLGDRVFTAQGNIATVSGIFPQGSRPIYKITLSDNTSIRVSDNHLNCIKYRERYGEEYKRAVLTTQDLIQVFESSDTKYEMDAPQVDWSYQSVPMDPYLYGALLGRYRVLSGTIRFADTEQDVRSNVNECLAKYGRTLKDVNLDNRKLCKIAAVDGSGYDLEVDDTFTRIVNELGLRKVFNKRTIDPRYIYNSTEVRLRFLAGLFDTNGNVNDFGSMSFSTTSKEMSDSFELLVRSLGIYDKVSSKVPRKCKQVSYSHRLRSPGLLITTSEKHLECLEFSANTPFARKIVSIEYEGDEECQCIYLDHEDHTYISDGFIPTHNTTLARLAARVLNGNSDSVIEIDAASNGNVESMSKLVEQMHQYPVGERWKVFILDECHATSNAGWQKLLAATESQPAKSILFMCTTNPEKIPNTILSRVQTFRLSKISLDGIYNRLIHIIECENDSGRNITYEPEAIQYIAKLANGGLRDSITLLDKALAYSEDLTSQHILTALNVPQYDDYFTLLNSYAKRDNVGVTQCIDRVYNSGINFVKWFEEFHSFVMNIVKYILLQDINKTMIPSQYGDKIAKYNSKHLVVCLKLANKLLQLNNELKSTQYQQEVALTYLCSIPEIKSN